MPADLLGLPPGAAELLRFCEEDGFAPSGPWLPGAARWLDDHAAELHERTLTRARPPTYRGRPVARDWYMRGRLALVYGGA